MGRVVSHSVEDAGVLCRGLCRGGLLSPSRGLATSAVREEKGFLSSFFERKVEVQKKSHSDKFAQKERISEIQSHYVRPDSIDKYLKTQENLIGFLNSKQEVLHGECLGNFNVLIGDQDQFVHIWRYEGGYQAVDENRQYLLTNQDYRLIMKDLSLLLRSRESEYYLQFSFWPDVTLRNPDHIYELRSYHLKPGTMVEWGNYWAKAIKLRDYQHTEAYMGLFSQIGELYNVKHIWCYESLEARQAAREVVWQHTQDQWQEIVARTVPLIRRMSSRVMVPLHISPTK